VSEWSPDIARLCAFDDGEWLRVEREYAGRLYAYIAKRIRDAQACEDVLQETLLGSVRGIETFDPTFTFEQYLFGICHNRTIDYLRRRRVATVEAEEGLADRTGIEALAREEETPSRIARGRDLERHAEALLGELLRQWVQETWLEGEFVRLMVIEALFRGGWRNKDTWERFALRDETSVAGIKFRAIARLREMAKERAGAGDLLALLANATESGEARLEFSVAEIWKSRRASCPARHWLARWLEGSLPEGPRAFLEFHLNEMECPWCQANLDDLKHRAELAPVVERVGASTLKYLRSRTRE
jgi:RNA polymerase sigma factor (sigma-70 family)